ncbi:hypothetical protein IEQ34_021936 [Dendrobium chrysotoxum]|uniref:Uncharacterized protein n=1 Tax=Dendrobium chrysotoxum TaxID=161865 RepID=A0AAV7FVT4_DENCH|nr:hypothetical protein IEQ34_021936 [Dendrobium chrysotoxum]
MSCSFKEVYCQAIHNIKAKQPFCALSVCRGHLHLLPTTSATTGNHLWPPSATTSGHRTAGHPDFILIDCPAGIDACFITTIAPADEAVLVTTPDITALRDADRVTGLLECDGIRGIKMIVNRVRIDLIRGKDMMSVLDVQEMLGLPLLGVISKDDEVLKSTNRGFPLVLNKPPALAGLAFEQAAWRLVKQDSKTAIMVEAWFLLLLWRMKGDDSLSSMRFLLDRVPPGLVLLVLSWTGTCIQWAEPVPPIISCSPLEWGPGNSFKGEMGEN